MKLFVEIKDYNRMHYGLEFCDLMEQHNFKRSVNYLEYGTDEFYRILELAGDKYCLSFEIYLKFTIHLHPHLHPRGNISTL